MRSRHLAWEGCFNARDLGGLPTVDGRRTRYGAVVRSDAIDRLEAVGWAALAAHGIRTIVDLRNDDERRPDTADRPDHITTIHVPLDGIEDREFWDAWDSGPQCGTPLYYRPHLDRFPRRSVAVLEAIARARPGGVLFHCYAGRDRTGLIAMLLLTLVGVGPDDIADDYALSEEQLRVGYGARGEVDQGPVLAAYLAGQGTTARAVMLRTMRELDIEAHLHAAGLGAADVAALRRRVLDYQGCQPSGKSSP